MLRAAEMRAQAAMPDAPLCGPTEAVPAIPTPQGRPRPRGKATVSKTPGGCRNRRRQRCPCLEPPPGLQTRLNLGRERHLFGIDLAVRIDHAAHRPHQGGGIAFPCAETV